ncbi:hypothetical protein BDV95DRAFT_574896 [Massariosphaeria phaeospora]|uniref:F-box domain-containing protein n=1 Tax=Massariosphaeria phaeospora TaxID=100035 RepID=A0A7C8M6H6_9PLEO|nr:hypothetical protein BDV95DRAFT_574896 [Massariosphaeria phaeospora]
MASASLNFLPTEILLRIASFLPCSSVLNLQRVNRHLHTACNDRLLFRAIAEHPAYMAEGLEAFPNKAIAEWQDAAVALEAATLSDTVRMAFAVEQAINLHRRDAGLPTNIDTWLPQLMMLRHPAALALPPTLFLDAQDAPPFTPMFSHTYMVATILRRLPYDEDIFATLMGLQITGANTTPATPPPQHAQLDEKVDRSVAELGATNRDLTQAEVRKISFAMLFSVLRSCTVPPLTNGTTITSATMWHPIALPRLAKMPFHEWMHIPPVYGEAAQQAFSQSPQLQKMTTPEFLSSGEWQGYYTDQRWGGPHLDPPMRSIRLDGLPPGPGDRHCACLIDSTSYGHDLHGFFDILSGKVSTSGQVQFVKRYAASGWEWYYKGWVTPFGMVGYWGRNRGYETWELGGYWWIWKVEWCGW